MTTCKVEWYEVNGHTVHVARADLLGEPPFPAHGKTPGARELLSRLKADGVKVVGFHNAKVSNCGWLVAAAAQEVGIECVITYPGIKRGIPWAVWKAGELGAHLLPVRPNYSTVEYNAARAIVQNRSNSFMLSPGMADYGIVSGNVAEQARSVFKKLRLASLVTSVGTATTLSGILMAAMDLDLTVYGISSGMSINLQREKIEAYGVYRDSVHLLPPEVEFDVPDVYPAPFPCNQYWDLKAWRWLCERTEELKHPVLFWNVGGWYGDTREQLAF